MGDFPGHPFRGNQYTNGEGVVFKSSDGKKLSGIVEAHAGGKVTIREHRGEQVVRHSVPDTDVANGLEDFLSDKDLYAMAKSGASDRDVAAAYVKKHWGNEEERFQGQRAYGIARRISQLREPYDAAKARAARYPGPTVSRGDYKGGR